MKTHTGFNAFFYMNQLTGLNLRSWELVRKAYYQFANNEQIYACNFDERTGYVTIELNNGVEIISCEGQDVCFGVYDNNYGGLFYFDTYESALKY